MHIKCLRSVLGQSAGFLTYAPSILWVRTQLRSFPNFNASFSVLQHRKSSFFLNHSLQNYPKVANFIRISLILHEKYFCVAWESNPRSADVKYYDFQAMSLLVFSIFRYKCSNLHSSGIVYWNLFDYAVPMIMV